MCSRPSLSVQGGEQDEAGSEHMKDFSEYVSKKLDTQQVEHLKLITKEAEDDIVEEKVTE